MKNTLFVMLLALGLIATGCTVQSEGSLVIDCNGFTATNWTIENNTQQPLNVTVTAYDSKGKVILDKSLGTLGLGISSALSASESWTTQPAPGPILIITNFGGNMNSRVGNCGNVNVPVTPAFTVPKFTDGRINPDAAATIVGYCRNASLEVYVLNSGKFYKGGALTKAQVDAGLQKAAETAQHVLLLESSGQQVWALTSGELQFHSATEQQYDFIFKPTGCG